MVIDSLSIAQDRTRLEAAVICSKTLRRKQRKPFIPELIVLLLSSSLPQTTDPTGSCCFLLGVWGKNCTPLEVRPLIHKGDFVALPSKGRPSITSREPAVTGQRVECHSCAPDLLVSLSPVLHGSGTMGRS